LYRVAFANNDVVSAYSRLAPPAEVSEQNGILLSTGRRIIFTDEANAIVVAMLATSMVHVQMRQCSDTTLRHHATARQSGGIRLAANGVIEMNKPIV
jgi:hypothetical protein